MTHAPPCHFFVDEAGDPNLFNRRKEVIVGREGCSRYFLLGCLEVADPESLHGELERLRKQLLDDPLVNRVPSMQPERGKTARAFHAKDDILEVRYEVFNLLRRHELSFRAVFLDKTIFVKNVIASFQADRANRYNPNQLYDLLVTVLFMRRIGREGEQKVTFATRGNTDRTHALRNALAQANSLSRTPSRRAFHVTATTPHHSAGLQAADYFLWAVQRALERGENRYAMAMRTQLSEVWNFNSGGIWAFDEVPGV